MGVYVHFTDEQKYRANNVELADFLQRRGEKLLPSGRDKRLASDHSITVRGNEWYDHSAESGGYAIDFVRKFYGCSWRDDHCSAELLPRVEYKEFIIRTKAC